MTEVSRKGRVFPSPSVEGAMDDGGVRGTAELTEAETDSYE